MILCTIAILLPVKVEGMQCSVVIINFAGSGTKYEEVVEGFAKGPWEKVGQVYKRGDIFCGFLSFGIPLHFCNRLCCEPSLKNGDCCHT